MRKTLIVNENNKQCQSTSPLRTLGSVAYLLAGTLDQGNTGRCHKPCNIVSTWKGYTPYVGTAGMLLHINGKFIIGRLKSSVLS